MDTNRDRSVVILDTAVAIFAAASSLGIVALLAITAWHFGSDIVPQSGLWAVVPALLGAAIGSTVPYVLSRRRRYIERKGEVEAMLVETHIIQVDLQALITEKIAAPLYRLPVSVFTHALPRLIGDGVLSFDDKGALVRYLNDVEEINRGLERCGDAHAADQQVRMAVEHGRVKEKAITLLEKPMARYGDRPLSDAAFLVLSTLRGDED